jgi:diaphanous 1
MMAAAPLIVPTLIPNTAIHFAAVQQSATAQDVIDALSTLEEIRHGVLLDLVDLEDQGWAVQVIRRQCPGKPWDEEELQQLGNGNTAVCSSSLT